MLYIKTHRIEYVRLPEYDYSNCAWYYVTININQHKTLLGVVKSNTMFLNALGEIVRSEWVSIPQIRANVGLDEYVVTPNHMHKIIFIEGSKSSQINEYIETLI